MCGCPFGVVPPSTTPPADVEYPVHNGGGNWTLSDGSKFRGKKDAALEAEAALHVGGDGGGGSGSE